MKKKKLKKGVYYIIVITILLVVGGIFGYQKYQEYLYRQTYEYKLTEHGYTLDEAKDILQEFSDELDIAYYLVNNKDSNLVNLIKEKYYLKKNFYKYTSYMEDNKNLDLTTVVRNINIHLDEAFYETNYTTDASKDTLMLVNKYYALDKEYVPDDLVSASLDYSWGEYGSNKVREIAYDAYLNMWNEAKANGYYFMINSAYRSFENQEIVYNNYKSSRGQKYADSIAARPGNSEHQTGLALDIFSKAHPNINSFKESEEAGWLKENAHRFGFIQRYPEGLENITGYEYEAWHYRYVGIDAATYIYENNITFEEYYAYFLEK